MDIFNNPLIKSIALGQLKGLMKENGLKNIIISLDEKEEAKFDLLKEDIREEVINLKEENKRLLASIQNFLK